MPNRLCQTSRCDPQICREDNQDIRREPSPSNNGDLWVRLMTSFMWSMSSFSLLAHMQTSQNRRKRVQKQKHAGALTFRGCWWDHTPPPLPRGQKVWREKPIWRNRWHGCRISDNAPQPYFFHECQFKISGPWTRTCPPAFGKVQRISDCPSQRSETRATPTGLVGRCVFDTVRMTDSSVESLFLQETIKTNEHTWMLGWSERTMKLGGDIMGRKCNYT